jgi:hypothetical protein
MARAVDLEKVFRSADGVVDLLAELEWQDGVLGAVDDEDGCSDLFQIGLRVELGVTFARTELQSVSPEASPPFPELLRMSTEPNDLRARRPFGGP